MPLDNPMLAATEPGLRGSTSARLRGLPTWVSVWVPRLGPPVLFLLASVAFAWPTVTNLGSQVPLSSDGILFAWHFEWIAHSVTHFQNPLGSPALNAPHGVNEMWNTSVLLLSVLCVPFTLTIGPFATVALLNVIAPAVSGAVAYAVLRRLTGKATGALIGAIVYAYGPFAVGQFGHLHILFAPFPPLLAFLGYRLLVTQRGSPVRLGLWLGLITGLQLLISEEIVALSALAAATALFWLALFNWGEIRARARHVLVGAAVALPVVALIAGPPLIYQFYGPNAIRTLTLPVLRADLASFVRPGHRMWFASRADIQANLKYPANGSENTGYLGWPLIIAALAVSAWFILRRQRFALWWLLTTVSLVVLMLGTPISYNGRPIMRGPWVVIRKLPLFGGAIPVRLSLLVALMIAGLIAFTLARLQGPRLAIGAVVALVVLIPLFPAGLQRSSPLPATPAFFSTSAVDVIPAGALTVVLPQAGFPRVPAMAWQIKAHDRFYLVGGYSVFTRPDKKATYFPALPLFVHILMRISPTKPLSADEAELGRSSLASSGVQYIVITSAQRNSAAVAAAAAVMAGCPLQQVAGVVLCAVQVRR